MDSFVRYIDEHEQPLFEAAMKRINAQYAPDEPTLKLLDVQPASVPVSSPRRVRLCIGYLLASDVFALGLQIGQAKLKGGQADG